MISRLVLLLSIAGSVLFGAIILWELEPAGADNAVIAQTAARPEAGTATRSQSPRIEELVDTVLARPLFSMTRRPPQNASAGAANDGDLADTRLAGIITTPKHRMAIFTVTGDKPLRVGEGDAVSGWRIESITPREVSLSGPSGTKTLQPKLDPNLVAPPGPPPAGRPGARPPTPPLPLPGAPRLPVPPVAAGQPNPAVPINPPGVPPRPARLRQQQ